MPCLQKFIIHPLTAFFFAVPAGLAVQRYGILEFPLAPWAAGGFVFLSYLFLLRRSDTTLTVIFFLAALFVFYRGLLRRSPVGFEAFVTIEQEAANKLTVLATLAKTRQHTVGHLPMTLEEFSGELVTSPNFKFSYCALDACLTQNQPHEVINGFGNNSFLVIATNLSDNKDITAWISDKDFTVFARDAKGKINIVSK